MTDDNNENKKAKDTKMCYKKYYKHFLEAVQLKNKINQLGKNNVDVGSHKENHKEFIKKQ